MTALQPAPPSELGVQPEPPRRPSVRRRPVPAASRGRGPVPRTVAGRVRALTAAAVIALAVLVAVTAVTVGNARDGVSVIGHDAGPQVVATGNLYYHLTDMDAQLANALLIGTTTTLGTRRTDALTRYDRSRLAAGDALLRAAKLADEPTEERTARESLNALARYERLAGQALLLDQRAAHRAGPPPQDVISYYRQATGLMKQDLLPKAYNLTLDNGTLVRTTYESERQSVLAGQAGVLVLGLAALVLLGLLQLLLYRRFRRVLNPALVIATVATFVLVAASTAMLVGQLGDLRRAKTDGFDSLLALSRARAYATSANADETRYLLDPELADTYEQVYLSKSQSVLYRPEGSNVTRYNQEIQQDLRDGASESLLRARFLGFLGREADYTHLEGQPGAYLRVLETYRIYQQSDARVRQLARAGQTGQAIEARLGSGRSSARAFAEYDAALQQLIDIHGKAFDDAVGEGDAGTRYWDVGLPIAGLLLIGLILAGVRPRLAEYR